MKIPERLQPIYEDVSGIITTYCKQYLSDEYCEICLRLFEKLCCKRPSPLLKDRANTWAAGIVYTIASNNFIFDKTMPIHMTADELVRPFDLAPSTAASKAAEIRKMIEISPLDTEWLLNELIDRNPAVWMLSINGYIVDARDLPLEIQQEAVCKGLIPYLPHPQRKKAQSEQAPTPQDNSVAEASQADISVDSPSQSSLPDDFSDIYNRFQTD